MMTRLIGMNEINEMMEINEMIDSNGHLESNETNGYLVCHRHRQRFVIVSSVSSSSLAVCHRQCQQCDSAVCHVSSVIQQCVIVIVSSVSSSAVCHRHRQRFVIVSSVSSSAGYRQPVHFPSTRTRGVGRTGRNRHV